jgi:predicted acyl esterase
LATILVIAGAAACSSSGNDVAAATFHTIGSAEQVFVTDATPGHTLELRSSTGKVVASARADRQGSKVFRKVPSGSGYRVRDTTGETTESAPVTVESTDPTPTSTKTYDQTLPTGFDAAGKALKLGGYGYLMVRDGIRLAVNVRLPGPADKGPYPTVIEYGGYAFARPGAGESSIAPVWNALGFAVVDVNMRGTGCSGGAFDFFEPNQILDGYDAIETVARQPWVLNHKVGMVGISYGGISQLFVAQSNPPHLAAITPDSVIEGVTTTLRPGAMLNTGFAYSWAKGRVADAKPASPTTGQSWAWDRIKAGDATCKSNQKLHSQAVDLIKMIKDNATYVPEVVDPITLSTFVHKIKMPTYLSCQWEDEQTGGACAFLSDKFTGTDQFWSAFTNGTHVDSLDPVQLQRQFDLLEMYVAERKPDQKVLTGFGPAVYSAEMGVGGVKMPVDPIAAAPNLAAAKAEFNKLPRVQVLFDNGHGSADPGAPLAGFEHGFSSFRDPSIKGTPFYFTAEGSLSDAKPTTASSASFIWDPKARPKASMHPDDISDVWKAQPAYAWKPLVAGKAVSWISSPLTEDLVVVGGGSADLWLQSTEPDTDLQVTISEVRPDGQELFVQNGWLRASYRKLDAKKSTALLPYPSGRRSDLAPLVKGAWTEVHVPLYAQGHAYRKGSRLRISIEAPGGDQPQWEFDTLQPKGQVVDQIAISPSMPSRVLLPVATGVTVPTPLPATCVGMRGQPCRTYVAAPNTKGSAKAK